MSKCCNAEVVAKEAENVSYYKCVKCGMPCEINSNGVDDGKV